MNWEIRIDICTLPCVKQWKAAIEHRELSLVLSGDLGLGWGKEVQEGWDICIYIWPIHFIAQQRLTQHCRTTIPPFFFKVSNVTILDGGNIMVTTNICMNTF